MAADKSKFIISIDRDVCIGAGPCVAVAGRTFNLDDENKAYLMEGDWDDDDMILAAAQSCPVFAISIVDKETGLKIFPSD
jgi:ferredoxin